MSSYKKEEKPKNYTHWYFARHHEWRMKFVLVSKILHWGGEGGGLYDMYPPKAIAPAGNSIFGQVFCVQKVDLPLYNYGD